MNSIIKKLSAIFLVMNASAFNMENALSNSKAQNFELFALASGVAFPNQDPATEFIIMGGTAFAASLMKYSDTKVALSCAKKVIIAFALGKILAECTGSSATKIAKLLPVFKNIEPERLYNAIAFFGGLGFLSALNKNF